MAIRHVSPLRVWPKAFPGLSTALASMVALTVSTSNGRLGMYDIKKLQSPHPSSSNMSKTTQQGYQASKSDRVGWYVNIIRRSPRHRLTYPQDYEAKGLEYLNSSTKGSKFSFVHVPRLLKYDSDQYVLIMEDAGAVPTLKSWLRADSPRDQIVSVGQSLGTYLAQIHNTSANNSALKQAFKSNIIAQDISSSVYFGRLPAAAEKHGYTQPFIKDVAQFAANEVRTAGTVWTLGDFWTGNVLVSAQHEQDTPKLTVLDLEMAKPGTAAFDIGQMGAEMFCLAQFRYRDQGSLLLQAFFQAYKADSLMVVDAAAVAIRM